MKPRARCAGLAGACLALVLALPANAVQPQDCPVTGIEALSEQLEGVRRFVVEGQLLGPLLSLWPVAPEIAARLGPDAATLFARDGTYVLVALTRSGCVVGAYEANWEAVQRGLREMLGPAI